MYAPLARRADIARKCPLTVTLGPLVKSRLRPHGTNAVEMLEPNKYECGIACLVFGYGTPASELGIDLVEHKAVWPPITMKFSLLQTVLQTSAGAGRACVLYRVELLAAEVFRMEAGIFLIHCRWLHPENRGAPLREWDWDSNYEHCTHMPRAPALLSASLALLDHFVGLADCVWNADRQVLFVNPDIVIPEPGDLDDISAWVEYLAADHGIVFATKAKGRVRQLMLDSQSSRLLAVKGHFAPELLEGARYL